MRLDNTNKIDTETPRNALRKQNGFTLIEVLIAVTIFAVGLLAIAAMQTSAIRMNSTGNRLTELSTLGIDKLEELTGLPYTDQWLNPAGNPPGLDLNNMTHEITTLDGYLMRWFVADNTPVLNTKRITLTVSGKGKTLTIVSIRAQSL
jgi:type IV pilus assembly protein PilV